MVLSGYENPTHSSHWLNGMFLAEVVHQYEGCEWEETISTSGASQKLMENGMEQLSLSPLHHHVHISQERECFHFGCGVLWSAATSQPFTAVLVPGPVSCDCVMKDFVAK